MAESSVDIVKARDFLKMKEQRRKEYLHERYKKAQSEFHNILTLIIKKYNPKRIYQWGSLLYPDRFSEISDIDIAIEGIDNYETFSRLYGEAEQLSSFLLDLIEIDKIHPLQADSIRKQGKVVYERK
jgi:predicted nucleotidyltransferase